MATPDDIQKQLASRQPKVTPVGDVPAATARAAAPSAMDVPNTAPTAQATGSSAARAQLQAPPDFIGDAAGGVQRNTPEAPLTRSAAQVTTAPNWQTSQAAGAPPGTMDVPQTTRAVQFNPSAATAAAPQVDPNDVTADFQKRMKFDAARRAKLAAEGGQAAPAAGAVPEATAAPSAAVGAAETVADDVAKQPGLIRRVIGSAGRLVSPALRYAGPAVSFATAGTRIAGAEGNAYRDTLLTSGSESQARGAANQAGVDQGINEGGGFAGGVAGAKLGSMVPGPPALKLVGGLVGGIVGAVGGQKAAEKLTGTGSSGTARLPDGVYQMAAPDDVPRMDASGKPAPIPLNTDVLRLQQGGAAAAADFDKKFGAGTSAYYLHQTANSNGATNLNMTAPSAAAQQPGAAAAETIKPAVNFIAPGDTTTRPPVLSDMSSADAMKSNIPGTAVINGHVLTKQEIDDAGKRLNIVPSTAFTNPVDNGIEGNLNGTVNSDGGMMRVPLGNSASAQRMFGTDAGGNPIGVSGGIGAPQDPRQSTIAGLMNQISTALRSGRRRTARVLVDQLSAFDRASQGQGDLALRRDALNKPPQATPQTPAQTALDEARAGAANAQEQAAQMSLEQAKQAQQIQAALQVETDPGKRKVLQQNLAAITGKGGSSAAQLKLANFTTGSGLDTRTIPVPIDLTTGRPVISPEYIQLIQSLQGGQPQAPQKKE